MRATVLRAPILLMVAGCFSSCSDPPARDRERIATSSSVLFNRVERDTLPSGALLVQNYGNGLWTDPEREALVVEARIDGTGGADAGAFGRVNDVTLDPLHRIYVADAFAHQVQVFNPDGSHLRTLGREGEGPGEFSNPYGFVWRGPGELWVLDFDLPRLVVFDTAGTYVRTVLRPPIGVSFGWESVFDDGLLVELAVVAGPDYLVALDSSNLAEMGRFPNPTQGIPPEVHAPFFSIRSATSYAVAPVPFAPRYSWALDGHGGLWIGWGGEYRIAHRTLAGDTTLVLTRPDANPAPVSAGDRARVMAELPAWADEVDVPTLPATKPFFWDIVPTQDGGLWVVREEVEDTWLADVFTREGEFLGSVELPNAPIRNRRPYVTEEAVVMATKGPLDVPYVLYLKRVSAGPHAESPP